MSGKERKMKQQFFDELSSVADLLRLFEYLPDIHFFVKNQQGDMVAANSHFAERLGYEKEEELVGRSTFDISPRELGKGYLDDDRRVMNSGEDMVDIVELNQAGDGSVDWFLTCKIPLYRKDGSIAGIAGIARDIKKAHVAFKPYDTFAVVFDYIAAHYGEQIRISDLAKLMNKSLSRFERQFRSLFGVSPRRYLIQYRINQACRELVRTGKSLVEIASDTGFYDQSSMTRLFSRYLHITPGAYRKRYHKRSG